MIKHFLRFSFITALIVLLITSMQTRVQAQEAVVSYQTFYDELSPYGQWVSDAQYGNVWVPNEEPGYRPYATRGHWAMTDAGNMWVSDAPWGWACYHYGRWTYNGYYGWVWIPGHEWAPAWVSWRSGGGYYGWAPMGPGYYAGGNYEYPENYWVFVSPQYLYHPNVYGYYEPRYTTTYIRQTTYINETYVDNGSHTTYYYGPRREAIERETNQPVQVYRVSNANTPGAASVGGNSVNIYRPAINSSTVNTARPANVIRASQPVGKPEMIATANEGRQPAFHQEMQKQNPAFREPNHYSNSPAPAVQPARTTIQPQGRPMNNQFNHSVPTAQPAEPANRATPQNNEPQGRPMNNQQPVNRQPEPLHNNQQGAQSQPQQHKAAPAPHEKKK